MIDTFKVKADVASNSLLIQLRGFFMKSEVELAFYLARKEITKLSKGFKVVLDLDGMHTDKSLQRNLQTRARHTFESLGASSVKSIGAISRMAAPKMKEFEYFAFESVGFYPN